MAFPTAHADPIPAAIECVLPSGKHTPGPVAGCSAHQCAQLFGIDHITWIRSGTAARLAASLAGRGISTQTIYRLPVPLKSCHTHLEYVVTGMRLATGVAGERVNSPTLPKVREDEVRRVAGGIRPFQFRGGQ